MKYILVLFLQQLAGSASPVDRIAFTSAEFDDKGGMRGGCGRAARGSRKESGVSSLLSQVSLQLTKALPNVVCVGDLRILEEKKYHTFQLFTASAVAEAVGFENAFSTIHSLSNYLACSRD